MERCAKGGDVSSVSRLLSPSSSSASTRRASSSSSADDTLDSSESESESRLRLCHFVLLVESLEHGRVLEHVRQDHQTDLGAADVHEIKLRDLAIATGQSLQTSRNQHSKQSTMSGSVPSSRLLLSYTRATLCIASLRCISVLYFSTIRSHSRTHLALALRGPSLALRCARLTTCCSCRFMQSSASTSIPL